MATKKDKEKDQKELSPAEAKAAALKTAIDALNKKYTDGTVMKLGSIGRLDIPSIPTGILPLDVALGIGGLPRGRIVEIYGPEASGKTTVTLHMIASVQKQGGTAVFIDAEHALDPIYAKKLGVDIDELIISQPDNGEQGLEIADQLISSGAIDIIVIDSVAALVPKSEIDGEMGDNVVGLHARMMSKAMRKLAGTISKTGTVAIFINQLREKVGGYNPFGPSETTTGGRALKFYATVRLEVRRAESITGNKTVIGNKVKIKVSKNKVAPPFKVAELDLIYGEGFSKISAILKVGAEIGVIRKSGGNHWYGELKLGKSTADSEQYLYDHLEMADEIEAKVIELLRKGVQPVMTETAETAVETEPAEKVDAETGEVFDADEDRTFSNDGDEI
ncbi:MAG: recombinase RecA [Selenomonadaceae bacterium]|nr:recombinase RecA [Selenomonadaceae bacterium]